MGQNENEVVTVAIRITRNASSAFSNTRISKTGATGNPGIVSPSVTAPGSAGAGSRRKGLKRLAGRKNGESRQRVVFSEMLVDIAGHVLFQRWERSLQHCARQRPPKPVADIFRDRGSPTLPAVRNAVGRAKCGPAFSAACPGAVWSSARPAPGNSSSSNRSLHRSATIQPRSTPTSGSAPPARRL
jgi:hypothetical protein